MASVGAEPAGPPARELAGSNLQRGWRAMVAALPEGWHLVEISRVADEGSGRWQVWAEARDRPDEWDEACASIPGDALLKLAARLRARAR
ncbi:MAG: hypothetical protein LC798_21045 [Chloroflexi bacterium]|nr:hypothetical protein [Chloroflexota bacterium]